MDLTEFRARLKEFDALREEDEIRSGVVEMIQPQSADEWPMQLDPAVRDALVQAGIPAPYQHQAEGN